MTGLWVIEMGNKNGNIRSIKRIEKILKGKIKNKNITFLGVTFKPNTDDMREASSLYMIPYLSKKVSNIEIFIFIKHLNKIGYFVKNLKNKNLPKMNSHV